MLGGSMDMDWHGKALEGWSGTKMPSIRTGIVGMELLHRMLLK